MNEETEVLKVSGFVGKPEYAKKTRGEQFFFVNQRFIKSAYLNHAINAAFEGLLKDGTHASYFLNLEVNPQTIDINIHPTKTEIKFDDEQTLYAILRASVKHSLGQFSIAPVLDFDRDSNLDTPYNYKDKNASFPTVEVDSTFNPFKEEKTMRSGVKTAFRKEPVASWESLYVGLESKGTKSPNDFSELQFESEEQTGDMFSDDKDAEAIQNTYQLHNKYIISNIKSGMLMINQHRAHQRVLYEDFLKQITIKESVSQQLLFPVEAHFSPEEVEIIKDVRDDLEHTGFVFSNFTKDIIEITGVPINVPASEVSLIFEQLIADIQNEVPESNFSATDLLAKSMAKSLAIKIGQSLTAKEQDHLVNSLFGCKEPNISPANKPTFITLSMDELDRKFI